MNKRSANHNQFNKTDRTGQPGYFNPFHQQQAPPAQQNRQYKPNVQTMKPAPGAPGPAMSGSCVLCKAITVLMCQRCGDFYCSPACQEKDWTKHRYICFQKPPLVHSSARLTQNMPVLNGYNGIEFSQSKRGASPSTPTHLSQNRKWINMAPSVSIAVPPPVQHEQQTISIPSKSNPKESEISLKKNNFSKPAAIKIEQVAFPKSNSSILLTAFRSSNRCFLRSIEKEENEGYCTVIKAINEFGKTAGPLKIIPTRNSFAITDFNNDGLYYRVQIVSVENKNKIYVIYYDFGNEATKKLSELKEISKECAELKQYVVAATLKNVPYIKDSDKVAEYLKTFEDVEAKIVYNEKEKPHCEIVIWGADDTLNQKINLFIQNLKGSLSTSATPPKQQQSHDQQKDSPDPDVQAPATKPTQLQPVKSRPSQLAKPVMDPPFEIVTLPVGGKDLKVLILDNSLINLGYFGCVLVEDKENLQAIQAYFSEYQDSGRPYEPKVDEYCVAKFEGSWYRAKTLSIISPEVVEVVFIDFLNESQVSVNDIRRYPMDLDLPCKSSLCMIYDIPAEFDDKLERCLTNKLLPGSEHLINEVKGLEEDESNVVFVHMKQVGQWLAEFATV